MVYIADVGEPYTGVDGRNEHRLRIIFDNGVESNQLMHSLQKRLWDDKTSRRITNPDVGPLFVPSGTVYVCRSLSNDPFILKNKMFVHKIGVTKNSVSSRLSGAENDPTFLFAKADLVAEFELFNIDRKKMESLLHKVFESARIKINIPDRFGKPVKPKEWFLVTIDAIEEAILKLKDGSLVNYYFEVKTGTLEKFKK